MGLALAWLKSMIAAVGRSLLVFDRVLHHVVSVSLFLLTKSRPCAGAGPGRSRGIGLWIRNEDRSIRA